MHMHTSHTWPKGGHNYTCHAVHVVAYTQGSACLTYPRQLIPRQYMLQPSSQGNAAALIPLQGCPYPKAVDAVALIPRQCMLMPFSQGSVYCCTLPKAVHMLLPSSQGSACCCPHPKAVYAVASSQGSACIPRQCMLLPSSQGSACCCPHNYPN